MEPRERFEAIFAAHYRDVHRYALRRIDPAVAEEIANEVLLICWRRLEQVPDPPLPWLYATAGNVLANHRRAAALRLVAWEGLTLTSAARAAGVSRPAFAMRVHRARRRLAAHLRELDAAIELDHMEPVDA